MININRVGEKNYNSFGSEMIIIKHINASNIDVYFPKYNYVAKNKQYSKFKKGNIGCPYEPNIYGGYLGEGEYKCKINGNVTKCYKTWYSMLRRCYDNKNQKPTYIDCTVCEEWYNFQNFAKWYEENYYEIPNEKMHLDKDILFKGNKIYSPQTCIFAPQRINDLFVKSDKARGKYPIGVYYYKPTNKFKVQCNINSKRIGLGYYNNIEEAFSVYKEFKENYIKEIADEYKNIIPIELYNAMYNYEVEITD